MANTGLLWLAVMKTRLDGLALAFGHAHVLALATHLLVIATTHHGFTSGADRWLSALSTGADV